MMARHSSPPRREICHVHALKRGRKLGAPVMRSTKAERFTNAYERQKKFVISGEITYFQIQI